MYSLLLILLFSSFLIFNVVTFNHHHLQIDPLHKPHGHVHSRALHDRHHHSKTEGLHIPHRHLHSRFIHFKRRISDQNSHPKVLNDLHNLEGCPGEICGTLSGDAVAPLLAGAAECAQQDMADRMIDEAKSKIKDIKVQKEMIRLAIEYRKTERNSFPDYTHQPVIDRNSLYCQKSPKNSELNGIFQTQSSQADPNLFFDPKSTNSLKKGSDPRTIPFGTASIATGANTTVGTNTTTTENSTSVNTSTSGASVNSSDSINSTAQNNSSEGMSMPMMNSTQSSSCPNMSSSTDVTTTAENNDASDEKSADHE
ncbi:hypothetical protein DFH28DRAFT_965347 [Melampsora americana]|nr:hypothetical protein DFH28DRAFT_965347 [Melampsora americana]